MSGEVQVFLFFFFLWARGENRRGVEDASGSRIELLAPLRTRGKKKTQCSIEDVPFSNKIKSAQKVSLRLQLSNYFIPTNK